MRERLFISRYVKERSQEILTIRTPTYLDLYNQIRFAVTGMSSFDRRLSELQVVNEESSLSIGYSHDVDGLPTAWFYLNQEVLLRPQGKRIKAFEPFEDFGRDFLYYGKPISIPGETRQKVLYVLANGSAVGWG